jgi:hypothetical protein
VLILFCLLTVLSIGRANDDNYMREVIEEAQEYMEDEMADHDYLDRKRLEEEEELKQRQEQLKYDEQQLLAEQQRQENERIQREREAAFQAELQRMSEDKRKEAIRRKKQDGKVVRKVLKAAERGDHYGTLGIRNFELQFPSASLNFGKWSFRLPKLTLFRISSKVIRRAYRNMALLVHPDKNRDGRAVQAFVAVENAASILGDDDEREKYDAERLLLRKERTEAARALIGTSVSRVMTATNRSISTFRRVLGPFAFPVAIIGILIV